MVSFKERLDNLETIKIELKDKLLEYGISEPTDVLAKYPDKIREIKNELMRDVVVRESNLPSEYWYSVCYGDGKFVAVASNPNHANTLAHSIDGITWTQTEMPVYANWSSVCYGNGKF